MTAGVNGHQLIHNIFKLLTKECVYSQNISGKRLTGQNNNKQQNNYIVPVFGLLLYS